MTEPAPVSTSIDIGQLSTITVMLRGSTWPGESVRKVPSYRPLLSQLARAERVFLVLPSAHFNKLSLATLFGTQLL